MALDTYDVNAIRKEPQDVHEEGAEAHPHVLATDMLSERNPNEDKNDSTGLDDLGGRWGLLYLSPPCAFRLIERFGGTSLRFR